jgi:hypothetical protein
MRSINPQTALVVLLLIQPLTSYSRAGNLGPGQTPIDPAARLGRLRTLASDGRLPGDRVEDLGPDAERILRSEAPDRMVELAEQLQALYDLGGSSVISAALVREIETRSEIAANAAYSLLAFVSLGMEQGPVDPVDLAEESYDEIALRIVNLYLGIANPLTEFINGSDLDSEVEDELRLGLETMEALLLALPESEFSISLRSAPER